MEHVQPDPAPLADKVPPVEEVVAPAVSAPRRLPGPLGWYLAVWVAFAAAFTVAMWAPASDTPVVDVPGYVYALAAGVLLTLTGPAVAFLEWRAGLVEDDGEPASLPLALLKGSASAFAGVALWAASLVALDLHRTGWL